MDLTFISTPIFSYLYLSLNRSVHHRHPALFSGSGILNNNLSYVTFIHCSATCGSLSLWCVASCLDIVKSFLVWNLMEPFTCLFQPTIVGLLLSKQTGLSIWNHNLLPCCRCWIPQSTTVAAPCAILHLLLTDIVLCPCVSFFTFWTVIQHQREWKHYFSVIGLCYWLLCSLTNWLCKEKKWTEINFSKNKRLLKIISHFLC